MLWPVLGLFLFLLTEFCVNKDALWLLVSQSGCKIFLPITVWSILFLAYSLHPLLGPVYRQGWSWHSGLGEIQVVRVGKAIPSCASSLSISHKGKLRSVLCLIPLSLLLHPPIFIPALIRSNYCSYFFTQCAQRHSVLCPLFRSHPLSHPLFLCIFFFLSSFPFSF